MSLFAPYPAEAGLIRAEAEALFAGSSRVWDVQAAVAGRHSGAVAAVDGSLTAPLSSAVQPVSQVAGSVSAAATVAGGALELFADAVAAYDAGVEELNGRFEAARVAGFYAEPVTAGPGGSLTAAEERQRYDDRVFAARARLVFELGVEEARLRADLDAAAETTAAVLGRGPTPESVRFLAASKAFPATTGLVFSGVGSDDDDHTDYLAPGPLEVEVDLSDDDDDNDPSLLDYLRAVPAVVDVGTDLAWEEAKDAAGATKDGISNGAGWMWNHGGEPAWNFLAGDAINSCREDILSGGCAFNAVTTVPLFKAGKALKYVDDVFDRGDDLRDADKAVDKAKDATKPSNIGPNRRAGDDARDRLRDRHPIAKVEQTERTPFGRRRIDILTSDRIAIESKVGRTSLTKVIKEQIAKDKWLLENEKVEEVQWVFSRSAVTGKSGPTESLQDALDKADIPWTTEP